MPRAEEPHRQVLPDYLAEGLGIVFVGTAASDVSAERGHYYANPGNHFWQLLHQCGLTPRRLRPEEDRAVLEFRLGLTDVAKDVHSGDDSRLPRDSLVAGSRTAEEKLRRLAPRIVCFTSKNAYRSFFGRPAAAYGLQPDRIGESRVFVTPSPSGRVNKLRVFDGRTRDQWFQELRRLAESECTGHRAVGGADTGRTWACSTRDEL